MEKIFEMFMSNTVSHKKKVQFTESDSDSNSDPESDSESDLANNTKIRVTKRSNSTLKKIIEDNEKVSDNDEYY